MSYLITITSNSDIGNTTDFTNQLRGIMEVKPNSYVQVNSVYIKKTGGATDPEGIYLSINEFSSANTYFCNSQHNSATNGIICNLLSFDHAEVLKSQISSPKIPLNNSTLNLSSLHIQLRDKDSKIISNSVIDKVAITLFVSNDLRLFG